MAAWGKGGGDVLVCMAACARTPARAHPPACTRTRTTQLAKLGLKRLMLSGVKLGDKGAVQLASALKHNSTLKV